MARVEISSVTKSFGAVPVIHGVSIDIEDGQFVALVGPSGCGKSTLLRMIAGLEGITSGTVRIGDAVVNDLPPKQRNIAMVFQSYALYPHMTVADNMAFSLDLAKVDKQERNQKVHEAAQMLGLSQLLDRFPRQLSGGQRQRVAMGRALVRAPQVFLFDEPLSNLDAKLRVQMRAELKELHQRVRTTTVYVTHDQVEAMTMADKIVVMRDGIIEQSGPPLELYDRPANTFVASFIGSPAMNLLKGTMTGEGFMTEDGVVLRGIMGPPDAAICGIRPEHLTISDNGVAIDISVVEPTGAETQVMGKIGTQPFTAMFHQRLDLAPHTRLLIEPARHCVHFFSSNGDRLEH